MAQLQQQLNTKGAIPKVATDGNFGAKTRNAVIAFQRKNDIAVDRIVGVQTWSNLWN